MIVSGNDIKRLIPQRHPFIMIDTLEEQGDSNSAVTTLAVRQDNYFTLPDGTLAATGIIEHIAQSCSALKGLSVCFPADASASEPERPAPIGLIGEVKHFVCHRRPHSGELLRTTITFGLSFGNVTLASGQSHVGDELIAEAQLKIFMQ